MCGGSIHCALNEEPHATFQRRTPSPILALVPWIELKIDVPEETADEVAARLAAAGVVFEIRDGETFERPTQGRALFVTHLQPELAREQQATIQRLVEHAVASVAGDGQVSVTVSELHDESWRDAWKRFFVARRLGRRFLLRPSWDVVPAGPSDRVIDLDPGRAFGTGAHASTQLCLEAMEVLEEEGRRPCRVLDAGCGSGILAIAAARIWPECELVCLDVDPEAVQTARENAERNGVAEKITFLVGDAADVSGSFDLVLANIQLEVLTRVARSLAGLLSAGGGLVLSGLLEGQESAASEAYVPWGLQVARTLAMDEWRAVLLRRG